LHFTLSAAEAYSVRRAASARTGRGAAGELKHKITPPADRLNPPRTQHSPRPAQTGAGGLRLPPDLPAGPGPCLSGHTCRHTSPESQPRRARPPAYGARTTSSERDLREPFGYFRVGKGIPDRQVASAVGVGHHELWQGRRLKGGAKMPGRKKPPDVPPGPPDKPPGPPDEPPGPPEPPRPPRPRPVG
jgi:hypothetical protein